MVCGQFPPKNGLKLEIVLFESEWDNDAGGISNPLASSDFLSFKKD